MSKKLDLIWHLFLYIGLGVGVFAVYVSRFSSWRQFLILLLMVSFYVLWGFVYHHTKKETTWKLAIEYLLIALIALGAGYLVLVS